MASDACVAPYRILLFMANDVYLQVAVDVPLRETFTYCCERPLPTGTRVAVPFGPRRACGIVTGPSAPGGLDPARIRPVLEIFDDLPPLPVSFLEMVAFAAAYYHHPYGQTLFTALPTALRQPGNVRLPDRRHWWLTPAGRETPPPAAHRARRAVWQALADEACTLAALRPLVPQASAILKAWLAEGRVASGEPAALSFRGGPVLALNGEQQTVLQALAGALAQGFSAWLLHGITGSGKTEVYLQLMARVLAAGQQVLVLIPEINLTPQLIERFAARFPDTPLVTLHSGLSDGERLAGWVDGWQGRAGIVIGTRLAVFTPLPRLGLIVVDEEHDTSFKQQEGLRYHARDLAVWRAHQAAVPVVLGSATPSLESLANVEAGRYRRLRLTQRAHGAARLPEVQLIDMRRKKRTEGLAEESVEALRTAQRAGQMSLVFINRRGYAPVLACTDCGWTSGCPHCSSKLVIHLPERRLRCHHCGWDAPVPGSCPDCGNVDIRPLGEGTQRLEAALTAMLPEARLLRIDRDTTRRKDDWDQLYQRIQAEEVDVLVGTQMLAKGHDFGSLGLVVVLNADSGLYSADFRATERLFALLNQVAGRAGRADTPGRVLIQTQWPDHPLYQALCRHDFDGYARTLAEERQAARFPPYCSQALLRADAPDLKDAMAFLDRLREALEPLAEGIEIVGPAPALMTRLAGRERAQLSFESCSRQRLQHFLSEAVPQVEAAARRASRSLRWSLDVDPQET